MNGNYYTESKNVEVLVDEIGQNTKKWIVSAQNESHTFFYNEPVDIDEKRQR